MAASRKQRSMKWYDSSRRKAAKQSRRKQQHRLNDKIIGGRIWGEHAA